MEKEQFYESRLCVYSEDLLQAIYTEWPLVFQLWRWKTTVLKPKGLVSLDLEGEQVCGMKKGVYEDHGIK
jgi:hypothetical protein